MSLLLELFVSSDEVSKAAGTNWLPLQLAGCIACWFCMRFLPAAKRYPELIATPFYCLVAGLGAYYLASLGGFEGPFFYSAYVIAPLFVFLPLHLPMRILMSAGSVLVFLLCFLGPHPEYLQYPLIHIPAAYVILVNIVSIALGHWGYKLERERFILSDLLARYNSLLTDAVDRKSGEVRSLLKNLQTVRETERADIARALHDDMGQLIVGARMELNNLERKFQNRSQQDDSQDLNFLAEIVEGLNHSSRTMIRALREKQENPDLQTRIDSLLSSLRKRHTLTLDAEIQLPTIVSEILAETVFRTLQEALTNVVKHSEASKVRITVRPSDSEDTKANLFVSIKDNGKGFPEEGATLAPNQANEGWGLKGMRERIEALNGSLQVDSSAAGTTLLAHLPLPIDSSQ